MTERFARKVILAVKIGTERELFIRKRRKTAVDENLRKDIEAKKVCERSLALGTVMIVDDYQQNFTIELSSTPTSTVYGANQCNVMVFPLVLYYKVHSDQPTEKATVIFVSDDLQHDHQQVWRMEQRAVKILEEKTYLKFTRIIRFSDGCGAQFKSRFAVADLVFTSERLLGQIGNGAVSSWHYFESNEGKSESDTAGSNFKVQIECMILKNHKLVITSARELVDNYKQLAPDETKRYRFCCVEEFPRFERTEPLKRLEVKIPGIRKIHQITFLNGGLKTRLRSCLMCLQLQKEWEICAKEPFTISSVKLNSILSTKSMNELEDEETETIFESISDSEDVTQEQSDDEEEKTDDKEVIIKSL